MAHHDSKLAALGDLGQSVWLDFISRDLLRSGRLGELVAQGVSGMTTNHTIFAKAIGRGASYDDQIEQLVASGGSAAGIADALIVSDVQTACDLMRPVYEHTGHLDGYVSIEVPPALAYDTRKTVNEAHRLHGAVARPNLMVKIPGTAQGLLAMRQTIAAGLNVNVTLLFALDVYEGVIVGARLEGLKGTLAVANAKLAHRRFLEISSSERWHRLAERGAQAQRLLWASTGAKNPDYDDLLYVDTLIGPQTVNTMPEETLRAFLDHGVVRRTVDQGVEEARDRLTQAAALGIDLKAITGVLQTEGVALFRDSFATLLKSVARKRRAM